MATGQPTVTYRTLPHDPGYRVGDDGSVWSCLVGVGPGRPQVPGGEWRRLRPGTQPNGGRYVSIRCRSVMVHRLVLEAFVGPCPDGMEACHADDDRGNNALSNLRWDTRLANRADAIRNGRLARGERHGNAKITAEAVRAIRAEYAAGGTTVHKLAAKYHLSPANTARIIRRERWSHIL